MQLLLILTFSNGFNRKSFGPCSLSLPPDTQCFLSPTQHELVSTLKAKIPRNFRYFFDKKKQKFTSGTYQFSGMQIFSAINKIEQQKELHFE